MTKNSFLLFPLLLKENFKKNHINTSVDYHRFSIKIYDVLEWLLATFCKTDLDDDNSNVYTNSEKGYTITKKRTSLGFAYCYTTTIEWIGAYQIFSIEFFNQTTMLQCKSAGRIDFVGAFFHFSDVLDKDVVKFYFDLENLSKSKFNSKITTTRVDIAVDIWVEIPFMLKYFRLSKNAKKTVKCYSWKMRDDWRLLEVEEEWYKYGNFQSYGYLPQKWKWYWIRVYNKHLDIIAKWKELWYAGSKLPEHLTRFEFVYTSDYCVKWIDFLIEQSHSMMFWEKLPWWMKYKSATDYSLDNVYIYLDRYIKKRWKDTNKVISELYWKKVMWSNK